MTRFALAALAFLLAGIAPLRAGDAANLEILGFTEDGAVFAFEEYGVQDGSGFPYANRFYIDTATDRFLPGTPVRVRIDEDGASVAAAREAARERAQAVADDSELAANRGFTAGLNPVTELSADPFAITVNPRPVFPAIDPPLEFRLTEFEAKTALECGGFGEIRGFRLERVREDASSVLHEDGSIPESRGCPLGYAIGGVQTFFPSGGEPVFAVLVAVRRVGFEGPDFRWLAVTGRL